ncbi:ATP-binding cassette domain-containing protein [Enterococcus ureasiticus]|nr:ATP-binding cassette domain-containing protein [Enterococcus sp. DIV0849a]MBO0474097.1 ATP-binding cassette domain-containing protein [Enterococcus ureasiticus]
MHFCKIVCIHEHIESLPLGYSSFIEENAANFSGGQKQRLALARSLLRKSPIIIMDEATSSIDSYTEKKIIDNLMTITSLTVIIIAHRLSILKECSHIYVMEQKKIVEQGTHLNLLQKQGTYYNLLGYSE